MWQSVDAKMKELWWVLESSDSMSNTQRTVPIDAMNKNDVDLSEINYTSEGWSQDPKRPKFTPKHRQKWNNQTPWNDEVNDQLEEMRELMWL